MKHFLSVSLSSLVVGAVLFLGGQLKPLADLNRHQVLAAPPPDFTSEIWIDGLTEPTAITFTPDGRMLILERDGTIYIVQPGATEVDTTPFMQLTNINTDLGERGLVGISLNPNFESNGYFYLYYTANSPLRDRVSRFTASGNTASLATELVLWQDNVQAEAYHHGGALAFGADGKLYISVGEGDGTGFGLDHVSQRLDSYHGKLLRINADGTIPADNPFYDGGGPNLDAIWVRGLRNPFRIAFDSPTGQLYIGDVGGNNGDSIEEVNRGVSGANYGWPFCEGPCDDEDEVEVTSPLFSYNHNGRDASIIGGFVYRGTMFPPQYHGNYFYGDYAQRWIRGLSLDTNGTTVTGTFNFEPEDGSEDGPYGDIVDLKMGTDGALYYVDLGISWTGQTRDGTVRRISYNSNQPPVITQAEADITMSATAPVTITFSGAATDPESDPLTYTWTFGDGAMANLTNATHTYTQKGLYTARLRVSDGINQTSSDPINIIVGVPPSASITTPISGTTFRAGDTITFNGIGLDADGSLSADNYSWLIRFHHDNHIHPAAGPISGTTGTYDIPTTGHDYSGFTRYEIVLTVTDTDGLQADDSVFIFPEKVNLSFDTLPSGLEIAVDGLSRTTPFTIAALIDFQHSLVALPVQTVDETSYNFVTWSDGGATTHAITVPAQNQSYLATYQESNWIHLPVILAQPQ